MTVLRMPSTTRAADVEDARAHVLEKTKLFVETIESIGPITARDSTLTVVLHDPPTPEGRVVEIELDRGRDDLTSRKIWFELLPMRLQVPELPTRPSGDGAQAVWRNLLQSIAVLVAEVEPGEELDPLRSELAEYTRTKRAAPIDDASGPARADIYASCRPFIADGCIHVHRGAFTTWRQTTRAERLPDSKLLSRMKRLGFESVPVGARRDGKVVMRRYWAAPAEVLEEGNPEDCEP